MSGLRRSKSGHSGTAARAAGTQVALGKPPAVTAVEAAPAKWDDHAAKLFADIIRLLTGVVRRLRGPLLLLSAGPVVGAALLIGCSFTGTATDVPWAVVVAVIGVLPAAWLTVRRRALLAAVGSPPPTAQELRTLLSPGDVLSQLQVNLKHLPSRATLRPTRLARLLWRGIKTSNALRDRMMENPRLSPFLPGRLRTTGLLAVGCAVSTIVLVGLAILELLLAAL